MQGTRRKLLLIALAFPAFGAAAQEWPSRPVRIIVAGAAGSSLDIPVRAERISVLASIRSCDQTR